MQKDGPGTAPVGISPPFHVILVDKALDVSKISLELRVIKIRFRKKCCIKKENNVQIVTKALCEIYEQINSFT